MIWLALPALAAAAYYLLAVIAAARWRSQRGTGFSRSTSLPPISILKPIHGRDPRFYEAIFSHAAQDYPEFEILFGLTNPDDPAMADIRRLREEHPQRRIEIVITETAAPNAKVGVLAELARRARHGVLLVNDSDIVVGPGYLRAAAAPLEDPGVGLVTCLYRARAESFASSAEALGVATEFAPSVLVARLLGVAEFALGSTMVFHAELLKRFGGFETIANYIADDYQLGCHITGLGYRIEFAPVVVETDLGGESWLQTWRHQLRWSRTIRVSRPSGYYGYVITHATLWSIVALAGGQWWAAAVAMSLRMLAGIWVGAGILRDTEVVRNAWMIPLRDLFGFAVWAAGLSGNKVQWRDRTLQLRRDGQIHEDAPAAALQR
ncbi:MAG TPA: bacteriohopanetetrol glucosamine biosynthesis glycosyltransferase HpnI [Candidatus Acidoferrales bacterium]|nr:bacteriohopanetetrol glucosamine biosynthesis glycosyltransferase HpnI [Candidatus Acidoferrales bacterium]HTS67272.1 bacteriohopanetetrol glucosamine biosynthesis glycosyltransferase HpnI [Candidatus Acidoferrales bacterium]